MERLGDVISRLLQELALDFVRDKRSVVNSHGSEIGIKCGTSCIERAQVSEMAANSQARGKSSACLDSNAAET